MTALYRTVDRTPERGMMARATGEFRPPRSGEWYLSGAIVETYQAPNDLPTPYHIARLVRVVTVVRMVER